jgi:2-iminobutanoate/2-iminopropanoate deaminase
LRRKFRLQVEILRFGAPSIARVVPGRREIWERMMFRFVLVIAIATAWTAWSADAQRGSNSAVKTLAPEGAIKPTGPWNLGTRAGDFIYIAGMRGIDPKTDTLVQGDEARIRQAFMNMKVIAESEGATLRDCVRIVVYVTDMFRYRPIVNKIQSELWGQGPYPPRTIVEVFRLNQDDIAEVEGTFYKKPVPLTIQEKEALFRNYLQWLAERKSGH